MIVRTKISISCTAANTDFFRVTINLKCCISKITVSGLMRISSKE